MLKFNQLVTGESTYSSQSKSVVHSTTNYHVLFEVRETLKKYVENVAVCNLSTNIHI